ncbi:MAG TPA: hypothetical protein ACFYD2_10775 [Candidatus Avalokitesvara rifleensis]|uniref:hypothetical protein n=1 Tax=Candidatus Avalokitesvara rifleensis TaxID=3367620 RepID=UPI002712C6EC|nr:hypothetical protein [Candidatus Brocadiales bacterium]
MVKRTPIFTVFLCIAVVALTVSAEESQGPASTGTRPPPSESAASDNTGTPPAAQGASLEEINQKMNNPVSDLWYLTMQYNHIWLDGELANNVEDADTLVFQPVLPISLTRKWNLITRPTFNFILEGPIPSSILDRDGTEELDFSHVGGVGDTVLLSLLAPYATHGLIWGVGPSLGLPTATNKRLGYGKWTAGPAGFLGYIDKKGFIGVLVEQRWSYAGWADKRVSETNIQYFAQLFLPRLWQIGLGNPTASIDWVADSGDQVTFPVGLNVAKMTKIGKTPVKFFLGGYYVPVRPDVFGEEWIIRFQISPTIPALIKGHLFE